MCRKCYRIGPRSTQGALEFIPHTFSLLFFSLLIFWTKNLLAQESNFQTLQPLSLSHTHTHTHILKSNYFFNDWNVREFAQFLSLIQTRCNFFHFILNSNLNCVCVWERQRERERWRETGMRKLIKSLKCLNGKTNWNYFSK